MYVFIMYYRGRFISYFFFRLFFYSLSLFIYVQQTINEVFAKNKRVRHRHGYHTRRFIEHFDDCVFVKVYLKTNFSNIFFFF